ncbi:hypothetical protein [Streptomyces sp. SP17KL33]|uniref:hypothetical protein n=1 Tax=Streptomyces sp. SP17KL33 TaxID=3002534 RepID=UPI002E784B1C|nr:hypothetical protein [Streptomyces sp. SP17KL33]MEE1838189.1 hypothetical protein [Streptomyces sp. SP17KL33]
MPTQPDDDELAIRARLVALLDGTAAAQPDAPDDTAAAAQPTTPAAQPQQGSAADPDDGDDTDAQPPSESDAQPANQHRWMRIPPWWSGRSVDLDPAEDDEEDAAPVEDGADDVEADVEDDDADENDDADAQPDADDADDTVQPPHEPATQPQKTRPWLRSRAPRHRPNGYAAGPGAPVAAPAPRMSLIDAARNVPPPMRWLVFHGSAAAAGYHFGWVEYSTRTAAWIADHGLWNTSSIFWCGCAVGCEALRTRMRRGWRLSVRWLAAIPISSIALGTALYGTDWQNLYRHLELFL